MNKNVDLINSLMNKKPVAEKGVSGFNINVDFVLEELARKPINTEEEKALGNLLHNASFINRDQGSIDEKIKATIDLLNTKQGVTTQYSCSSHPRYYFNLPLSFTKEDENKPYDILGVGKDSATGEYMLGYPHEFYIRMVVDNGLLPSIMTRVNHEMKTTKPAEELFGKPYTVYVDEMNEKAGMHGGNSLYHFMYIGENTLDYIDGLNVRVSPYDANRSILSIASDLISNVLFAIEDADSVYWALIERLQQKTLRVVGVNLNGY